MTTLSPTPFSGRSVQSFTDEELQNVYWQASQEIDRRGGHVDSYAAPHVWNMVAKILREEYAKNFELRPTEGGLVARRIVTDLALTFARRFAEDDGFDPLTWLDKCSPDSDLYPFSELWDEPDVSEYE